MRILNVTETYAPFLEFGGPPVKVRALAEGLARRGHAVTVLTADWGLRKKLEESRASAERSAFGWSREENGVQAIYLPTRLRYRAVTWNPGVRRYCRARLKDFEIAHIFGMYDLLGPRVAGACRKSGVPYVFEPIGMFVPIVRNLWLKRLYHQLWGRRVVEGASAVIATSEQEAEELAAGGVPSGKIVQRRNGVEPPKSLPERGEFRKTQGISASAKVVLYLGRLSEKKSPDLLLRAFSALPAEMKGRALKLVIAGPDEGGTRARLERMAAGLGVTGRVQFAGPIFGERKWAAYRDADVFVLPSQNENFGNTAAEAIAAGTPAVVTDRCGIAPLVGEEAAVVVPYDEAALEQALKRILGDEETRERLAANCARVTARLGWEEPVREMEQLYSNLERRIRERTR